MMRCLYSDLPLTYWVLSGGPPEHAGQDLQPLTESPDQMPIVCWFSYMLVRQKPVLRLASVKQIPVRPTE